MKTNMAETSLMAHRGEQPRHARQELLVLEAIRGRPGSTRKEIARQLGLEASSVAGRVNALVEAELVEECGKRKCRISGRTAKVLRATPQQQALIA